MQWEILRAERGKERRMAVYQIGDAINRKGEGKVGNGDDQDSRVCMTGLTRTRRMRKNQVEYKRAEGLGLYLEGYYYLLKLKANAKQGTSRLSISCHYRKN